MTVHLTPETVAGLGEGNTNHTTSLELPAPLRRVLHELRLSEQVFHDYGVQHQEKAEGCEPGLEREARWAKAKRNYGRAAACKAALDAFDTAMKSKEQSND